MTYLLYVIVILLATTLGAIAGLGGGVIIKPLLDLIGAHDPAAIGIYSCIAVFTMCVVSLVKQVRGGFDFNRNVVLFISFGSLVGGLMGERIFELVTAALATSTVKAIQAGSLAATLALILVYTVRQDRIPGWRLTNPAIIFCAGLALGAVSVFLSIGGGPLNVACMTLLFSFSMKDATVYSLATIFFSQIAKLGLNGVSGSLFAIDLSYVPAVVLPAVAGGLLGTRINRCTSDKTVRRIYLVIMVTLLALSCYNCAHGLCA